ncbi:MAG: peptidoglycan DD-metalloendopeptidase family protein [Cyclobacteriaceae bacterium]
MKYQLFAGIVLSVLFTTHLSLGQGKLYHPIASDEEATESSFTSEARSGGGRNDPEYGTYRINSDMEIDCVWINAHDYFATWTSFKVNPYGLDGAKFKDTVQLKLYDPSTDSSWVMPINNTHITSKFGRRSYRWHYGTDLKLQLGDSVRASFEGIVRIVDYERRGYGHYVLVRHKNGLETLYGHLSKTKVKIGEEVKAGQTIGLGGSTGRSSGTHLHYEVRYRGNAIDPISLYDFKNDQLLCEDLEVTPATFKYLKDARKVIYHRIRKGDSLSKIGVRYGVSINQLCRLNRINRKTILRIGRRLRIN